ncbi:MAG: KilA-N domain-containing protein [Chlorobi bacterium]|nr:MAG: KilA-N domain-containing protein [Bacteroidota bacterium]KXK35600.1 MAG: KilA-N domain protein [Chlorobi bacterium OLB6]MBL1161257.1 KilA-N domain-containing protein [Chlorobiota bacterium]MBW7854294.1 KilA-N domain-containing protein [Candidatus Kapabacteria bacterium]MCC6332044.1 KilA-N domain-containing protein [Ignavibacteria bacterium]
MAKKQKIIVKGTEITVLNQNETDFISLTDMTISFKEGSGLIGKWITNKNTLEYLGTWEKINNPHFNYPEFGVIEQESGVNRFIMSVGQWIERTGAISMVVKAGRYGGTYAHKDIAFHFAMWLSPEFQIYLINEFQRLKAVENDRLKLEWNLQRTLAKVNYHIHTNAIKENLIPKALSKSQISFVYANEADLLNVALFGVTAKQWRDANPNEDGNIRDMATIEQLVVLSNLESINAVLIHQGLAQSERLIQLNQIAITQMKSLINNRNIKNLK